MSYQVTPLKCSPYLFSKSRWKPEKLFSILIGDEGINLSLTATLTVVFKGAAVPFSLHRPTNQTQFKYLIIKVLLTMVNLKGTRQV